MHSHCGLITALASDRPAPRAGMGSQAWLIPNDDSSSAHHRSSRRGPRPQREGHPPKQQPTPMGLWPFTHRTWIILFVVGLRPGRHEDASASLGFAGGASDERRVQGQPRSGVVTARPCTTCPLVCFIWTTWCCGAGHASRTVEPGQHRRWTTGWAGGDGGV